METELWIVFCCIDWIPSQESIHFYLTSCFRVRHRVTANAYIYDGRKRFWWNQLSVATTEITRFSGSSQVHWGERRNCAHRSSIHCHFKGSEPILLITSDSTHDDKDVIMRILKHNIFLYKSLAAIECPPLLDLGLCCGGKFMNFVIGEFWEPLACCLLAKNCSATIVP